MHENVPTTPLYGFGLLALDGPDAQAFAQAQFANDVASLAPSRWQWSCWLTPKGRVLAVFALLKFTEDRIWLVLPDAPADTFADRLQRFVFRSRVRLSIPESHVVAGAMTREDRSAEGRADNAIHEDGGECWWLDFGGAGLIRQLRLVPRASIDTTVAPAIDTDWRLADIRLGLPRLPFQEEPAWTPQMLSLDRLPAYSVRKGCYPGQEIVARTHFLGNAKRALVRLRAESPLPPTGTVTGPGGEALGTLVCTAEDDGACEALAVLALGPDPGPIRVDGHELVRLPLLEGLARP